MKSTITPLNITPADILPNKAIKPGDVIVFSGVDIVSRLIQFVTRSPYSHVAIVISVEKGQIFIAESTLSGLDYKQQKLVEGVQIAALSNRITGASSIG
ncbi:CHAP domain-containing protein [Ancylothrix sp. C2]|uniref:CHAP domain-containing protein n=1 Tax=Ancylothrix sp. D3o TaxID=2953691 RepID=UPI0021BAAF71|nr:CHAP domain-containing protein [Ancylothrix sp. D3o]MCT7952320.1 CHAP domain-containing protein [Ancylothrix sp. D3o]